MNHKIKILVDGNCIVCDFEVSHYKRMAPEIFEIVDISSANFKAEEFGLTASAVDEKLHVIDTNNQLYLGVDAFICIWKQLPLYKWLAWLIKLPIIYSLAKIGYVIFAKNRKYLPKKNRKKL